MTRLDFRDGRYPTEVVPLSLRDGIDPRQELGDVRVHGRNVCAVAGDEGPTGHCDHCPATVLLADHWRAAISLQ